MINSVSSNMFRPNQGINPDDYARQYASQNGISVFEAREQLKAQFGDPVKPEQNDVSLFSNSFTNENSLTSIEDFDFQSIEGLDETSALQTMKDMFQKLLTMLKGGNGPKEEGDPEFGQKEDISTDKKERLPESKEDKDQYAHVYAYQNNITLEEAREILKSKEPSQNPFSIAA